MKILKIINNNAVLMLDSNGTEVIALGPGIGWNKKNGEAVNQNKIDQVFVLKDKSYDYIIRLLRRINPDALECAQAISRECEKILGKKIEDQLIFTLADHITYSLESYEKGRSAPNLIIHEVRLLYPNEYKVGEFGVELINEKLNVKLPEDEMGYIALHLVAGMSESSEDASLVISLTHDIITIIKEMYGDRVDDHGMNYTRFLTHIKYLARRIMSNDRSKAADVDNLLLMLMKNDPDLSITVASISELIEEKYQYKLEREDEFYLIIHMLRVLV